VTIARIKSTLLAARDTLDALLGDEMALRKIEQASHLMIETLEKRGHLRMWEWRVDVRCNALC